MPTKRVVIIANGDLVDLKFYRGRFRPDDYIICVNGGTGHALALGFNPDLIIGDLDSLAPEHKQELERLETQIIIHPKEKDASDLELAVDYAVSLQPVEILIIGALGGKRIDHTYINLLLLYKPLCSGIPAVIIDEYQEVVLVKDELIIEGNPGDCLSLFTLTSETSGIVTEGLQYPLGKENLHFASSRGLSNILIASRAKITIDSGLLLVIRTSGRDL